MLERTASALANGEDYHQALYAWLVSKDYGPPRDNGELASRTRQTGSYRQVATLAVRLLLPQPTSEEVLTFQTGLDWTLGTSDQIAGVPTGLAADPVAVLAMSLAQTKFPNERLADFLSWLESVRTRFGSRFHAWEQSALSLATSLLRSDPPPAEATIVAAATDSSLFLDDQQSMSILRACLANAGTSDEIYAAFLLSALQVAKRSSLAGINLRNPTIADVVRVLNGVSHGLQEWTWESAPRTKNSEPRKWHVENEYHVQNLLWAVLAPLFADLKREEFSPQVGPLQPRVDLAIPSLALVIEVKFVRRGKSLKEVINQIAEDASLYFVAGSKYRQLIAFVWDDGQRTEEHLTIASGIRELPNVVEAILIGRPGKMV